MSYKFLLIFFSFLTSIFSLHSQNGPGGVGDSTVNPLWLKADSGTSNAINGSPINFWRNTSRNRNHVWQNNTNQQPIFRSNVMNGYPAIEFDNNSSAGQNDFLEGISDSTLDGCKGLTILAVVRRRMQSTAPNTVCNSIVAKRDNVAVNQAYMFFFWNNNYLFSDIVSNNDRFDSNPVRFDSAANYIVSNIFDGSLSAASRNKIFNGENLLVTSSETSDSIPHFNSPLIVGTTHIGDTRAFGGFIAEIIIFRKTLNEAERIIVNNYLSAKYNIAISNNDVYRMDDAANGDFDHEVAGIGRIDANNINNDAQGTGIVRFSNPSDLDNDEFLMWGHNNAAPFAFNNFDIPPGLEARFDRVWRVSELDTDGNSVDVGSVDITFDLRNYSPVFASDLRLLIDLNNNGNFNDDLPISGAVDLGGGFFQFQNVSQISNALRFTLGTIDTIQTPLPVELNLFRATKIDNMALIEWATSIELNNSHFTVLKSYDGNNWTELGSVQGNGNSDQYQTYKLYDYNLKAGLNYYKLIQTDFDGKTKEHGIRIIESGVPQNQVIIQPNPSDGFVNLHFSTLVTRGKIEILNTLGQVLVTELFNSSESSIILPETPGVYLIRVTFSGQVQTHRVLRN